MENEWEKYAKRLESDEVSIRLKESQGYRSELGKVEEALETGEPPRDIYILEPEIGEDGGVVAEGGGDVEYDLDIDESWSERVVVVDEGRKGTTHGNVRDGEVLAYID